MKISKSQLRQMIREERSTIEADVQKMVSVYIKASDGAEKAVKLAKGKDKEQKLDFIIRNLKIMFPKMDFYHHNMAAMKIYNMGKPQ
tara:strand:- start:2237 stop:2497 length:261 start_codon:yes stop_codon:yes gene_type:complete